MDSAPAVAELVAPVLGWDAERVAREVQLYAQRVQAERESQQMPDDQEANAERTSARDARLNITAGGPSPQAGVADGVPKG